MSLFSRFASLFSRRVFRLKLRIFLLTYFSYAIYTATRLPMSISKSTLNPDKIDQDNPGYDPFNGSNGSTYLGLLDTFFLIAYTIGLFISGPLGDRWNLRFFLGFGMIFAGFSCCLFGLGYTFGIHQYGWFVFSNVAAGFFQSTGWPGNVTLLVRWFGKSGRGTIMGIWNSQSSLGSIIGKLVSTASLSDYGWAGAFIIPGILCGAFGVLLLLLLIPHPSDVLNDEEMVELRTEAGTLADEEKPHHTYPNIPFVRALLVPGVISYSLCLFFSKFVAYAFIFWLPYYLTRVGYDKDVANNLSTVYDVGGVFGGIIAGLWSDYTGKRGFVSFVMLLVSVPLLFIYSLVAGSPMLINATVMFGCGVLVNGPYTLISSAVAADLGSHPSLKGNPKALSTVTGIIDGFGSLGAAAQGGLIGVIGSNLGWDAVLYVLMFVCTGAAACIGKIVYHEFTAHAPSHIYQSLDDDNNNDLADSVGSIQETNSESVIKGHGLDHIQTQNDVEPLYSPSPVPFLENQDTSSDNLPNISIRSFNNINGNSSHSNNQSGSLKKPFL